MVLVLIGITLLNGSRGGDDVADVADVRGQKLEPLQQNERLQVYFLDVGQGDSIYIRTPGEQDILIDGGPDKSVLNQLGEVMPFWDREIDVMILTHPHSDHVTGLVEVLRRYSVKQIYYTGALHTAPDYLAWLEEIKKQNLDLKIVEHPFEIDFGNEVKLQFLFPQKSLLNQKMEELNNSSIVNKLVYKNVSFLFMGDVEEPVEEELLKSSPAAVVISTEVEKSTTAIGMTTATEQDDQFLSLKADVLKVGHHGSSSSSSEEFLEAVSPQIAVIQVGKDNEFGHPHLKILKRLERLGVKIWRNDEDGRILLASDGNQIFIDE